MTYEEFVKQVIGRQVIFEGFEYDPEIMSRASISFYERLKGPTGIITAVHTKDDASMSISRFIAASTFDVVFPRSFPRRCVPAKGFKFIADDTGVLLAQAEAVAEKYRFKTPAEFSYDLWQWALAMLEAAQSGLKITRRDITFLHKFAKV